MFGTSVWSQELKFYPRDEAARDTELAAFVAELKSVVAAKDTARLTPLLDTAVQTDWDGVYNIPRFKELWRFDDSDSSLLWPLLDRVLNLGGAFTGDKAADSRYTFVLPYIYMLDVGNPDSYFDLGVITGQNVNLREKPDLNAPVIAQLTYDVVTYLYEDESQSRMGGQNEIGEFEWYYVQTAGGQRGWVNWRYIYCPVDWRLFLAKKGGRWKITTFIAGD